MIPVDFWRRHTFLFSPRRGVYSLSLASSEVRCQWQGAPDPQEPSLTGVRKWKDETIGKKYWNSHVNQVNCVKNPTQTKTIYVKNDEEIPPFSHPCRDLEFVPLRPSLLSHPGDSSLLEYGRLADTSSSHRQTSSWNFRLHHRLW